MPKRAATALPGLPDDDGSPFVGRKPILTLVTRHFEESASGAGSVIFLSGEDGMGKTALLHRLATSLSPATIARVACGYGSTPSTDAIAQLLLNTPNGRSRRFEIAHSDTIETAIDALSERLTAVARRTPAVILVDDVHLASPRDIALLSWLVNFAAKRRILVVATTSKRDADSGKITLLLHGWLTKGCSLYDIPPLEEANVQLLLRTIALNRNITIEPAAMRGISEVAQGNPRLVYELVAEVERTQGSRNTLPIPASARAFVGSLKAALPAATFDLLAVGAVAGQRFDSAWLPTLADAAANKIDAALQAGCYAGLLFELADNPGIFQFPRLGERLAMSATLISSRRAGIHERLASLLLPSTDSRFEEWLVAEHLAASGQLSAARERYLSAAHRSLAGGDGDIGLAAALYERAAACIAPNSNDWADTMRESAQCYARVGLRERSASLREEIVPFFLKAGLDRDAAAELFYLLMDYILCERWEDAERHVQRVRHLAFSESRKLRMRVETMWAGLQAEIGNLEQAKTVLSGIESPSKIEGSAKTESLMIQAIVKSRSQPLKTSLKLVDAAVSNAHAFNSEDGQLIAHNVGLSIAYTVGSQPAARERLRLAQALLATKPHGPETTLNFSVARAEFELLSGNLAEVQDLVRLIVQAPHSRHVEILATGLALFAGARVGDWEMVRAFFDVNLIESLKTSHDPLACGSLVRGACDLLAARYDRSRAEALIDAIVEARLVDPHLWIQIGAARYGGEATVHRAREQILARRGGTDSIVVDAALATFDAHAFARDGRPILAVRSARRAAELYEQLEWPLFQAQACEAAGEIAAATELFARCGAHADVGRLRRAYTLRNRRSPRSTPLTQREREIAALVAGGYMDKDIARMLSLSRRTVNHHVSAILGKLGFRSRWQLAGQQEAVEAASQRLPRS